MEIQSQDTKMIVYGLDRHHNLIFRKWKLLNDRFAHELWEDMDADNYRKYLEKYDFHLYCKWAEYVISN